jgi:hypothetical protein
MQAHIVDLELLPLRFLPYGHEVNPESIVLIRTSRPTKRLEPEVENGPVCHIFRFAWLGPHEAKDFKACATTACLNGFALLARNHQGKHILSLTMRP